ncbi:MAG: aldose 1-epimerase family protein [Dermatophilaceae bacterium]
MTASPTGKQHQIGLGHQRAVVVQVGGGLRSYDVAGRAVLEGFPAEAPPDGGRGQLLLPWPNRIRDGRYRWAEAEHQLALSEVDKHNAIHGLLRWAEWSLLERNESQVTLGARLWPQPGYPFRVDVSATYELTDEGLTVTITARNQGTEPAPYGVGQHPYITAGTDLVDDAVLTVPAQAWVRCDDRGLPVATEPVAGTPFDFRSAHAIGGTKLDTPYAELIRDRDGRAVVSLDAPDGSSGVDLWVGEGAGYVQVFSGDTLTTSRRRTGLAVEPMSCPPDAFNSGEGLVTLDPGATHTLRWGVGTH